MREIGQQAFIMGRADQGPFSLASMLLGMETFLMALSDPAQKEKLHRLLEFSLEVVYRYAVAQMEQGAHVTSIGESLSGPDVCSPKMYKEYEWGYAKRLVERLQARNIRLAYHICGNATRIVNDMVATGASILELDYKCDLPKIKEATLGKATILGVIDPSGILERGTPDIVASKVREELAVLAPGGEYPRLDRNHAPLWALSSGWVARNLNLMLINKIPRGHHAVRGSYIPNIYPAKIACFYLVRRFKAFCEII